MVRNQIHDSRPALPMSYIYMYIYMYIQQLLPVRQYKGVDLEGLVGDLPTMNSIGQLGDGLRDESI